MPSHDPSNLNLAKLFQIVSPALPVGAFAYSQGLETAIDQGLVSDQQQVSNWCLGVMSNNLARLDLPALREMLALIDNSDAQGFKQLNQEVIAFRETSELRNESLLMAKALLRLLHDLDYELDGLVSTSESYDWVSAFAIAVSQFDIDSKSALIAYLWSWLENQVAAAIKLVPLGQTQGQKILIELGDQLEHIVNQSIDVPREKMANLSPALAILSSQHETQYSRLFRS
jgi:urease accessory protein